jgi:hypothetical protein
MNGKWIKPNNTMLTIQNFERLRDETIGEWRINRVCTDNEVGQGDGGRYVMTLRRGNGDGTAVFIDRVESEGGEHRIQIMYEQWDNSIFTTNISKSNIADKNTFLGMVLYRINKEYYKRNGKS